jgi:hypothetical protein
MTGTGPRDSVASDRRTGAPGRPRDGSPPASGNRRDRGHHGVEGSPGTRLGGPIATPHLGRDPVADG